MPADLATPRLTLRQWQDGDFAPMAAHNADPETMRFSGGVLTRHEAWKEFAALFGHWHLRGFGFYAVDDGTGLVGGVGLYFPDGWPEIELGWDLVTTARGKGYATEAAKAVRKAAAARGLSRLVSFVHPENAPSIRVANRLDARQEGTVCLLGDKTHLRFVHPMAGAAGSGGA